MKLINVGKWLKVQQKQYDDFAGDDDDLRDRMGDIWMDVVETPAFVFSIDERIEPHEVLQVLSSASKSGYVCYDDLGEDIFIWAMTEKRLRQLIAEAFRKARKA